MSNDIYDNDFGTETEGMKGERIEMMVDIYESADHVRDYDFKTETNTHKPLQRTGSDSVKSRSSRAAVVCLVLLCVLLLTAVIVLCVHIYTNLTEQRNELEIKIANLTEERNKLVTNITNLTEERNKLEIKNNNLTEERNKLEIKNNNLTEERNKLEIKNNNLTEERNKLEINITNLTEEIKTKREQLINQLSNLDEWIYYQFSFYYKSNETKNWTESRRDCLKKGADLIITNNREEYDFVMHITNKTEFWIGATDIDVDGSWKWVDGSTLTSGFWAKGGEVNEPGGGTLENCAVSYSTQWPNLKGWHDVKCNDAYNWICEKSILPLI
ncbi:C-type lectin domain family 4 member F-like [Carassius auratus]|uniref:C-type lectin domain family 4 member F-like n=1 Tax=Carassius auratus TaxID=7957 RepID=A0A6P6N5W5_CARAU|nr:C-type lectin domain family 4 member F-like [Carassius auratus]